MSTSATRARIALDLITGLNRANACARLFGGAALAIGAYWNESFHTYRDIKDIDIVLQFGALKRAPSIIEGLGGVTNPASILLNDGRLIRATYCGILVDLYSDPLFLNQKIEIGPRLGILEHTLSPADLLATKLQICARTERDVKDIIALLAACDLSDFDGTRVINIGRIVHLCSRSWSFFYATKTSLEFVAEALNEIELDKGQRQAVLEKIAVIRSKIVICNKTVFWKLRGIIGARIKWYHEIDQGVLHRI